jgi:2-isopropylmalate synthase
MVVSEQAGRAAVINKAAELGLTMDDPTARLVLDQVKEMEHRGYHFEAADGSFELLVRRMMGWEQPFFSLESFKVFIERRADEQVEAEATVKVKVAGERVVTTGEGVGPVHALDQALRAALRWAYPPIDDLRLTDYRVRVLESSDGTEAVVRVLLETSDHDGSWGTIGVHGNIIEASWEALVDGLVIGLLRAKVSVE